MTLRETLGGDARQIHELVDQLLDSEDSLIVLIDGRRAVSYGEGFGLSPCQIELITIEMERAVRAIAGVTPRLASGTVAADALALSCTDELTHSGVHSGQAAIEC